MIKSVILAVALTLGLTSVANAQFVTPYGYQVRQQIKVNYNLGPAFPYTYGPYGNYGFNPYVNNNVGYSYRYNLRGTFYPTPYGYNPYLYNQYNRGLYFGFGWRR